MLQLRALSRGAVDSVLNQAGVDPKVIIVDDASPDGSADIAREMASQDARIMVVEHAENQGHIKTYNDGLSRVTTPYVALLSADDLLAPGALSRAVALMETHPNVGLVYGAPKEFGDEDEVLIDTYRPKATWTIWPGLQWLNISCWRGRSFILSPEVVMRTTALKQVGTYSAELPHSGDLEFWVRTAARWDIGRINGPYQAYYRVHGQNMHLTAFGTMQQDLIHRFEAFQIVNGITLGLKSRVSKRLYRWAQRAISREALLLAGRNLDEGGDLLTSEQLVSIANRIHPISLRTLRAVLVLRRMKRVTITSKKTVLQSARRLTRVQLDRVRWTIWKRVGIS